jgi:hypothetical protein
MLVEEMSSQSNLPSPPRRLPSIVHALAGIDDENNSMRTHVRRDRENLYWVAVDFRFKIRRNKTCDGLPL